MPAPCEVEIGGREPLVDDDVGGQRDPPVQSLEKVMAEQTVFRNPVLEASLERSDLVDALSDEDTGAQEVLVDVRYGARIDVDRRISAIETGEERLTGRVRRQLDARLDDCIAPFHPA